MPTTPLFLDTQRLPLLRRGLIALGVAFPVAVWGNEIASHQTDTLEICLLLVPPLATLVLANVNHTGAQLVCRGVWWLSLLFGSVLAVSSHEWPPAMIAVGGGVALLSAWTAGLGEGEARGNFAPVAFRRSLMVSLVMAITEVQILGTGSAVLLHGESWKNGLTMLVCALLLSLGAFGIYRLRFWGVLVHLLGMIGVATVVVSALTKINGVSPILVWIGTVAIQMVLPLPMLLAIVRRRPVSAAREPSPLLPRLFVTMVLALVGLSLVSSGDSLVRAISRWL